MTRKPFKFRHVNRIAGAFLFFSAVILAVLVGLAAKSKRWFERETRYRVEMPVGDRADTEPGGTLGIRAGSDVRVIGNQVGHVEQVVLCVGEDLEPIDAFAEVDPAAIRIVAILSVRGGFSHFIGPDSVAVLKFDLGGLGSAYFDISRGTKPFPVDIAGEERQLAFAKERDAKAEVFEVVSRIEDEVVPAIRRIEETAAAAKTFFEKLNDGEGPLQKSFLSLEAGAVDFQTVMKQAASGDGALGDMIQSDSEMRREFNEFAVVLNRGTKSLERSIDSLGEGIDGLRVEGFASFNDAAKLFPPTMDNTNAAIDRIEAGAAQFHETVREFEVLVEALQKHWLVRKNIVDPVEDPKPKPVVPPDREGPSREGFLKKVFGKER